MKTVGDLAKIPFPKIEKEFLPDPDDDTPTASFLFGISRGVYTEEVEERTMEKSMSTGKPFAVRYRFALPTQVWWGVWWSICAGD